MGEVGQLGGMTQREASGKRGGDLELLVREDLDEAAAVHRQEHERDRELAKAWDVGRAARGASEDEGPRGATTGKGSGSGRAAG